MSTLQLVMESIENDSKFFDKLLDKCDSFFELSMNEYEVNLKESELNFVKESDEDKKKESDNIAKEGLIARAKETIKKIIEALKEAVKRMVTSVKEFFSNEKTKKSLNKIEKNIKDNKEISGMKVIIPNIELVEKTCNKFENELKKVIAISKSNASAAKDKIKTLKEEYKKEFYIAAAATTAVTTGTAIIIIKKYLTSNVDNLKDSCNFGDDDSLFGDENIDIIKESINFNSSIKKDYASACCKYPAKVLNALKGLFTNTKVMDPVDTSTLKENGDDTEMEQTNETNRVDEVKMESIFSDVLKEVEGMYVESENDRLDKYLENMEKELFSESGDDESDLEDEGENFEESTIDDIDGFLDILEKELFTESEENVEENSSDNNRLDGILNDIENSIE